MKPLDKKQIPQFAALCVLTAGLAGYLVLHLVAPGPVSAGTRAAAPPPAAPVAGTPGQTAAPGTPAAAGTAVPGGAAAPDAAASAAADAPPPTPGMHDPFAVGYVDPSSAATAASASPKLPVAPALPKLPAGKQTASIQGVGAMPVSFPEAPALPGSLSGFPSRSSGPAPGLPAAPAAPALPAAPAAPTWTVTGVLQGADGKVAILRNGDARRIVRSGDFVDSTYRVIGVTRTSVTLRHGTAAYQLTLGGTKTAPSQPAAPGQSVPAAPPPLPRQAASMTSDTIIPVYRIANPKAALAPLSGPGHDLTLASEALSVPRKMVSAEKPMSPAKVAASISLGLRLLNDTMPTQDSKAR